MAARQDRTGITVRESDHMGVRSSDPHINDHGEAGVDNLNIVGEEPRN